jgi:hypothetical protein
VDRAGEHAQRAIARGVRGLEASYERAPHVTRRRVPDLIRIERAVEAVAHVLDVVTREPADEFGADDG